MASELSRFIEDELRKQGINDDEEQRLLSNLRVKPLSVQATTPATPRGWSTKQKVLAVAGLAVLFAALVALVVTYRGHPMTTGAFRGAIADPEAGVEPLPLPESDQKGKGDAASGDKAQPKPPQDAAPDKTAGAEEDLEEDYEDYERKEAEAAREKEEEAEKAAADEKKEAAGKKEAEAEKPATKGEAAQKKDATSAATPTAEDKAAEGKEQKSEEDEEAKGGGRRLRRASLRR